MSSASSTPAAPEATPVSNTIGIPISTSEKAATIAPTPSEWNALAYVRYGLRGGAELLAGQRAIAYASEVGEASRQMVPRWLVRSTYGLSWLYVGADTSLQVARQYAQTGDTKQAAMRAGDALVFHSIGSMALPAWSIHTIVKQTGRACNLTSVQGVLPPRVRAVLPTVLGLGSIFFIVHPIDHATDVAMTHTVRRLYAHLLTPFATTTAPATINPPTNNTSL